MTDEQLHLIARILDGICASRSIEPYTTVGYVPVGRCRYCGVIGQVCNDDQVKYEHPDECVLALNARLQETLKEDN